MMRLRSAGTPVFIRCLILSLFLFGAATTLVPRAAAQNAKATGRFDLSVEKSPVLRTRKNHLESTSATVTYSAQYMRSRVAALKIVMPAGGQESATWVILVDKARKITQVNLGIMVPGSTVLRTVAWTAADIARYFLDYKFENGRLRLKSKGTYATAPDSPNEVLSMSWEIDLDVPVVETSN
jgi:hypothetical protein